MLKRLLNLKLTIILGIIGFVSWSYMPKQVQYFGDTMGTRYQILGYSNVFIDKQALEEEILTTLSSLTQELSTYEPNSWISRFNQMSFGGFQVISERLEIIINEANRIYQLTDGAWDGTVKPLYDLWGFSQQKLPVQIPNDFQIKKTMRWVGFEHLDVSRSFKLRKLHDKTELDLSSIAKGYSVDELGLVLRRYGITDFYVEIGGEVLVSGQKPSKNPWKIGINLPKKDAAPTDIYTIVKLENQAMATSGDYRQYLVVDGKSYGHILDPRTGYPVNNAVVSVTVVAPTCMVADALATALMVMGVQDGLRFINRLDYVEALMISENLSGQLVSYRSTGFDKLEIKPLVP